jgi:transposase
LTSKIHVLCDGVGHPLHFDLTAGQTHEAAAFDAVMVGADEHLHDAEGEPIAWPVALAGDKGYRADWIDDYLLALDITPVIPSKSNQDGDARPVAFDKQAYRNRNIVERLIGWLKECRRVFSRFEKTAKNFAGMIRMAFIQRYLRLGAK